MENETPKSPLDLMFGDKDTPQTDELLEQAKELQAELNAKLALADPLPQVVLEEEPESSITYQLKLAVAQKLIAERDIQPVKQNPTQAFVIGDQILQAELTEPEEAIIAEESPGPELLDLSENKPAITARLIDEPEVYGVMPTPPSKVQVNSHADLSNTLQSRFFTALSPANSYDEDEDDGVIMAELENYNQYAVSPGPPRPRFTTKSNSGNPNPESHPKLSKPFHALNKYNENATIASANRHRSYQPSVTIEVHFAATIGLEQHEWDTILSHITIRTGKQILSRTYGRSLKENVCDTSPLTPYQAWQYKDTGTTKTCTATLRADAPPMYAFDFDDIKEEYIDTYLNDNYFRQSFRGHLPAYVAIKKIKVSSNAISLWDRCRREARRIGSALKRKYKTFTKTPDRV